jgi:hypothetical protein
MVEVIEKWIEHLQQVKWNLGWMDGKISSICMVIRTISAALPTICSLVDRGILFFADEMNYARWVKDSCLQKPYLTSER